MAKFTRNPWLEIQAMKDEIVEMMEETHNDNPGALLARERPVHFKPVADVYETTENYVIQVEFSGLEKDAVTIEVLGNEMWIYGERRQEKEVNCSAYHALERSYGPFARQFVFPEAIDACGVRAVMHQGLLTITVLKKGTVQQGRRIEIQQG
ncbi:MAG: Hsp20 family protein [Desulfoplanes sp.]|jgi:HSP20 family protein|nr:Hsp20 family protein [Desulfoplanes sp.]MDD4648434.1 Hsp20 family protein [Desulfoplanes sp.]